MAFVTRHPKQAYRALCQAAQPQPTPEEASDDRFARALSLLTGLDVSLTFERDGVVWTIPAGRDGIGEDLFRKGSYGGETIETVLAFIAQHRPGRTWIVDVGSNIGTATVPFASAGYQVVAIEPVPEALRYLRANVDANGLGDRVRVVEAAVTSTPGDILIAVSTSLGNSEVIPTPQSAPGFEGRYGRAETISVRGLGLGAAVGSCGVAADSIALVWSDTQGSETAVIETGSALWAAGVPLFVEFWPRGLATKGGVDRFVTCASRYFDGFIDAANGGRLIADALGSAGRLPARPRAMAELHDLADEIVYYPGQFTDVLLLP